MPKKKLLNRWMGPLLLEEEDSDQKASECWAGAEGNTVAERSLLQKVIRKSLVDNKNDLEIKRKDPNCPLYSVEVI